MAEPLTLDQEIEQADKQLQELRLVARDTYQHGYYAGRWAVLVEKAMRGDPSPADLQAQNETLKARVAELEQTFTDLKSWIEGESSKLGAVDGYDYRSGEEYAYRNVLIQIDKTLAALKGENDG